MKIPVPSTGVIGAGAYLCFYRALAGGPISIVTPIVSGYAAVTVLLAVLILGEPMTPALYVGAALVVVGLYLTNRPKS